MTRIYDLLHILKLISKLRCIKIPFPSHDQVYYDFVGRVEHQHIIF